IWEPVDGQRDNIAVFHPMYGESFPNLSFKGRVVFLQNSLENPSIRISHLRMSDAGRYTCEYATYPSGNEQGTTTLVMLAKPKNSANVVTVQAGSKSLVVARQRHHAFGTHTGVKDGTASVRDSSPTDARTERDRKSLSRRSPTQAGARSCSSLTMLAILFNVSLLSVSDPPSVSIEGYDNNWYVGRVGAALLCLANANPEPTAITWTAASGSLPDTVTVDGDKLTVKKVDDAVNTTFICEVENKHGTRRHQITTVVIGEFGDPPRAVRALTQLM
uniref:Ig-like domain-containing protein n=1 Tax=Mola mola TaxID=94237 RepID=A0A3Q4A939_MOLML